MELHCRRYFANIDITHGPESGYLNLSKNQELWVPNICAKLNPVLAYFKLDLGLVWAEHLDPARSSNAHQTIYANGIAIRNFADTKNANEPQYSIGQLIMLCKGPWPRMDPYQEASGLTYVRVYNLATNQLGYVLFEDFEWFPNATARSEKHTHAWVNGVYLDKEGYDVQPGDQLVITKQTTVIQSHCTSHGICINTGIVGLFGDIQILTDSVKQGLVAGIEQRAQQNMPARINVPVRELIKRWHPIERIMASRANPQQYQSPPEIFDMALIRTEECHMHPTGQTETWCCVSYTGPHPTPETCIFRGTENNNTLSHKCCTKRKKELTWFHNVGTSTRKHIHNDGQNQFQSDWS